MKSLYLASTRSSRQNDITLSDGLKGLLLGLRGSMLIFLILSGVASAQVSETDAVIATASRLEGPENPDVQVLSQDALSLDVLESLGRLPGVTTFTNGGVGGSSFLSIRGGEPNFTLILFDGIRLNNSTNSAGGAFDFNQIEPAFIDRIEIERGAGSAFHGSDALSGVVNIISASPDTTFGLSADIGASLQTEGGYALSGLVGHSGKSGAFQLGLARRDSGTLSESSALSRDAALIRVNRSLGGGTFDVTAYHATTDRFAYAEDSGGDISPQGPVLEDRDTKLSLLGFRYTRPLNGETTLHAAVNFSEQTSLSDIPAIPGEVFDGVPARIDDTQLKRWEGLAFIRTAIIPDWQFVMGGGYVNESGRGEGILDIGFPLETRFSERREVWSTFAEASGRISRNLDFKGALRLDNPKDRSHEFTYKLKALYRPLDDWELHLGHSTNFKLPSIFATSYPLIANPDLEPEKSESFEVGLLYESDLRGEFRITAHKINFRNLVDFDPEVFTNVNRQNVINQGIELQYGKALSDNFDFIASVTFADIETSSNQPLRNRPELSISASAEYQFAKNISAYSSWQYVSDRFSSSVPTGFVKLNDYHLFDFGVTWTPKEDWSIGLNLKNGFDTEYSQAVGVSEPKRYLSLSINRTL